MRWLFLIMLSLNIGYVSWHILAPATESSAKVQPLKNVQPVVLLSEVKPQQTKNVTVELAQEQVSEEVLAVQDAGVEEQLDEPKQGESGGHEAAGGKLQQETRAGVGEKLEQLKPDELVLVEGGVAADAKPADAQTVSQLEPPGDERCFSLGPFRDMEKVRGLTREIKSYVIATDFRSQEEQEPPLYWIYTKPEKSRKKAIETGKRLRANKIKDFYVIRQGEKNNGVSLGYFRKKGSAYGLADKVKKLGFNVIVEPVLKTYTSYWLDYRLANGGDVPAAIIEKYINSSKRGGASRLQRDCGSG